MAKKKTRKSRKRTASKFGQGQVTGKAKTRHATKISKNNEEPSCMVTVPIDVIYSLNSLSIRHCSENYVKEESSELKTNSSNELQEEGGLYLDSEIRNFDGISSSRWLEVRRRSLENVSPAGTIIKEEFYESNDMDFTLLSLIRHCNENNVKAESSELETNSANELQEEKGLYLDSEIRNLDYKSSRWLEVRRRSLENVSPAGTIIKEEFYESNDTLNCSSDCSIVKDLVIDNNITQLPNSASRALMEHETSLVPVFLSQYSMNLTSINESTSMSVREVAAPISSSAVIRTERISPRQPITPRHPRSSNQQVRQTISRIELPNLIPKQPVSAKPSSCSADLMNRIQIISPRLLSIPTVAASPRNGHTVSDVISENSALPRKNTSPVGTSIEPERASSDEKALRHNNIFADPVSSDFSESTRLISSASGIVIPDEERNPGILTPSPERYSKRLSRKFQCLQSKSNEPYSKYGRSFADEHQCLLSLPRKRPGKDVMIANLSLSGERSNQRKRRRRLHELHSNDQYNRLCGAKYKHKVKSGNRKRLKPSLSKRLHKSFYEISSNATCNSPRTSADQRNENLNKWQGIRFSMSPEVSSSHSLQRIEDSDSDYGWEDPPPPKSKPNDPTWSIPEGLTPEQLQMKLSELDLFIQKKQDHYVRQLFNTDNFDTWDDDPALSNISTAEKLKHFTHFLPAGASLLEKMNLAPLVGIIKKSDTGFQGKELPPHLLDQIKAEKKAISDLVIKYLMPYYNNGRIQSENSFRLVARHISHEFYGRFADEIQIRTYIDDLFKEAGLTERIMRIHNLIMNECIKQ